MKLIFFICLLVAGIFPASYALDLNLKKTSEKDYTAEINGMLATIKKAGGGTLFIHSGSYNVNGQLTLIAQKGERFTTIKVVGVLDEHRQRPVIQDQNSKNRPHSFFIFQGDIGERNLAFELKNLVIKGNNVPYSKTHPFINLTLYTKAIGGMNLKTAKIENVNIENYYGDGIFLSQGMAVKDKTFRTESPIIRNCNILNTWGNWKSKNDNMDGIMLWQVNNALVENCVIKNDINYTKFQGRCGIVLEHNSENARIINNQIWGYNRNMHIECDFGGHLISKNTFKQSFVGINLSYDCGQDAKSAGMYKATRIVNNIFNYNNECAKLGIDVGDWGFISNYKPSFVLNGLVIEGNNFSSVAPNASVAYKNKTFIHNSGKIFINLNEQQGVVIKNNNYR